MLQNIFSYRISSSISLSGNETANWEGGRSGQVVRRHPAKGRQTKDVRTRWRDTVKKISGLGGIGSQKMRWRDSGEIYIFRCIIVLERPTPIGIKAKKKIRHKKPTWTRLSSTNSICNILSKQSAIPTSILRSRIVTWTSPYFFTFSTSNVTFTA